MKQVTRFFRVAVLPLCALVLLAGCAARQPIRGQETSALDRKLSTFAYIEEGDLLTLIVDTKATRYREKTAYFPLEIAIANNGATGVGWTEGDITGEGDVTVNIPQPFPLDPLPGDIQITLTNRGEPGQQPKQPDTAAGAPQMRYNPVTGEVTFSLSGQTDLFVNTVGGLAPKAGHPPYGSSGKPGFLGAVNGPFKPEYYRY